LLCDFSSLSLTSPSLLHFNFNVDENDSLIVEFEATMEVEVLSLEAVDVVIVIDDEDAEVVVDGVDGAVVDVVSAKSGTNALACAFNDNRFLGASLSALGLATTGLRGERAAAVAVADEDEEVEVEVDSVDGDTVVVETVSFDGVSALRASVAVDADADEVDVTSGTYGGGLRDAG
jgi:hypothetical protein